MALYLNGNMIAGAGSGRITKCRDIEEYNNIQHDATTLYVIPPHTPEPPPLYGPDWFYIEAEDDEVTVSIVALGQLGGKYNGFDFKVDDGGWSQVTENTGESGPASTQICRLDPGQKLYLRGHVDGDQFKTGNKTFYVSDSQWRRLLTEGDGKCRMGGSIVSLLDGAMENEFAGFGDETNIFRGFFSGCQNMVEMPSLPTTSLPKIKPVEGCYAGMFENCTGLIETKELPASPEKDCYSSMFKGCSNLQSVYIAFESFFGQEDPGSGFPYTLDWLEGVVGTGVIYCPDSVLGEKDVIQNSPSGLPSGWSLVGSGGQENAN